MCFSSLVYLLTSNLKIRGSNLAGHKIKKTVEQAVFPPTEVGKQWSGQPIACVKRLSGQSSPA